MTRTPMSESTSSSDAGTEAGGRSEGRSRLFHRARLVLDLWKIWAVGVLFLLIAWMAYGMDRLTPVVEPFYLLFAVLAFGYGIRRLREKIKRSYI